jgi:hypothetical protein
MLRPALLVAALAATFPAHADADLDALRAELKQLKESYETRIQALEARLQKAETETTDTAIRTETAAPAGNRLNPDISLILQGGYAHLDDIEHRHISGFMPAGHDHGAARGFSLDHTELVMSASVDPYFRGYFNLALLDEEVEIEEAWFQTTALGNGFSLKGGRFLSGLGYQNEQHPHAWDFADNSLMYRALFGEAYGNDGVQLKWVAPTELFMEFGAEAGRGANFPGTDRNANGAGSTTCSATSAATSVSPTAGAPGCRTCTPGPASATANWRTSTMWKPKPCSRARAKPGWRISSGNGRPAAMPPNGISSLRPRFSAAPSAAACYARTT